MDGMAFAIPSFLSLNIIVEVKINDAEGNEQN